MRPPLWGNFIAYADWDLASFAWLFRGGLRVPSYYHATQALEKYLKSLALSIIDPNGTTETPNNNRWLRDHNLERLASRCAAQYPYYGQPETLARLRRFSEFDQRARYPWVEQQHGNGFTSEDVPLFWELFLHLRVDIPIKVDDYPLGMLIRGHHQGHPENLTAPMFDLADCRTAVQLMFPEVNKIVRW